MEHGKERINEKAAFAKVFSGPSEETKNDLQMIEDAANRIRERGDLPFQCTLAHLRWPGELSGKVMSYVPSMVESAFYQYLIDVLRNELADTPQTALLMEKGVSLADLLEYVEAVNTHTFPLMHARLLSEGITPPPSVTEVEGYAEFTNNAMAALQSILKLHHSL